MLDIKRHRLVMVMEEDSSANQLTSAYQTTYFNSSKIFYFFADEYEELKQIKDEDLFDEHSIDTPVRKNT